MVIKWIEGEEVSPCLRKTCCFELAAVLTIIVAIEDPNIGILPIVGRKHGSASLQIEQLGGLRRSQLAYIFCL